MWQNVTLLPDIEISIRRVVFVWEDSQVVYKETLHFQAPVKTNRDIYENSMLEDDPNANFQLKRETDEPRWGPKHKGAQTLAKFYSTGE